MSTERTETSPPGSAWGRTEPSRAASETPMTRFLGGSPGMVFIRLVLLSFLVGAVLMWLDIRPQEVIFAVERFTRHLWTLGFASIRHALEYIAAGALIVVPTWLVVRLLNVRSLR